ncbi:hypothetical protein LCGC14_1830420 [marine sediment metagenome]|uniref:Uncharacterized protein n=1 Tax=marine sediment metagenome TaxID=412755 RepID=A0A0F9IBR1_9ZZZZ
MKCPTCAQLIRRDLEGATKARIATRPDAGPAQARHIVRLEQRVAELALTLSQGGRITLVRPR